MINFQEASLERKHYSTTCSGKENLEKNKVEAYDFCTHQAQSRDTAKFLSLKIRRPSITEDQDKEQQKGLQFKEGVSTASAGVLSNELLMMEQV